MKKQDLNGVRTASDVERRHNLGAISGLESDVDQLKNVDLVVDTSLSVNSEHPVQNAVITRALNGLNANKVDKVEGKELSDNNFTDTDKDSIHVHYNKSLLDTINDVENVHIHNNKAILDDITTENLYEIDKVYPIGSVYISINNTNPGTDLGGTWVYVDILTIGSVTAYAYKRTS